MWDLARILFRPALVIAASSILPLAGVIALGTYGVLLENSLQSMPNIEAALLIFLFGMIFTALSLLPSHAVSLVAGWLFGAIPGTLLALVTISTASVLGFTLAKALCGEAFTHYINLSPR